MENGERHDFLELSLIFMKSGANDVSNGFEWHKSIRNHSLIDLDTKICKQTYFIYVCKDELLFIHIYFFMLPTDRA